MGGRSVRRDLRGPPWIERSLTSGGGGWHFCLGEGARAVFWWYYKRLLLVGRWVGNVGPSDDRYIQMAKYRGTSRQQSNWT